MLKTKKLTLGLLLAVVTSGLFFGLASAQSQTITVEHINRIRANCLTAATTISQLHASDALLRVNQGQLYESLTTRLMSKFNTRVESNGLSAKSLVAVTNFYDQVLANFRVSYQDYAQEIEKLLSTDCVKDPVEFYNLVLEARDKREKVGAYVTRLNQNLGEYKSAFDAFVIKFNGSGGAK